jgi:hypothetical protein
MPEKPNDVKKAGEPSAQSTAAVEESPKLYVDGKAVSEEAYLDAAEKAGWDRAFLANRPERRPAISTKKHGE